MDIEKLIERYFEGETSAAEEKYLRSFFASGKVPEYLVAYIPLFAYFDEEIRRKEVDVVPDKILVQKETKRSLRLVLYVVSGVAACVLALLGTSRLLLPADPCFCSDNYVVINGRCYTDIHTVRSFALEALEEVATPADAYFPEQDPNGTDHEIIDNQLKELGSLFSEYE